MVLLISLPGKKQTKKAIHTATGYIPVLAQILFFTSAPKWIVFVILFGSSIISTLAKAGDRA